jgi:DNA primase
MHTKRASSFAAIKRAVPLEAVLVRYGVLASLQGRGAKRRGPCPIHRGTNREQFHVDLERSLWFCFGDCRRGGGVIDFVAAMQRTGVREAARTLAAWFSITERHHPKERR